MFQSVPTPQEVFQNPSGKNQILSEGNATYIMESLDGLNIRILGASFPSKVYLMPEAMFAFNFAKRLLREFPITSLFKPKKIDDLARKIVSPFLIHPEYLCPVSKQLLLLPTPLAEVIAHCFQYDNAYRARLQIFASHTARQALIKSPIREINRVLSLFQHDPIYKKLKRMANLASLALLIPPIRYEFRKFLNRIDFSALQLDEADRYWVLVESPEYLGFSKQQRDALFKTNHWTFPMKVSYVV